jgi:hypothetical protein
VVEGETAFGICDRGIRVFGDDDVRAHPGVQDITVDNHEARGQQCLLYAPPDWQPNIEKRASRVLSRVNSVQNWVTIAQC